MNALGTIQQNWYIAGTIALKDIRDLLRNKRLLTNLLIMMIMPFFFYYLGTARPWDKDVRAVVYNQSSSLALKDTQLGDGANYSFRSASSLPDLEQKMANLELGLVIPADFDQVLAAGGTPVLEGYIFWVQRGQVGELEDRYTRAFSEILGTAVQVHIGKNIIIPQASAIGSQTTLAAQIVFFVIWTAISLMPFLINEERQVKTLDALLVSPAGPGHIVLGKALAGGFYAALIGGLAFALNWRYIARWEIASLAFVCVILLAVGVGLAMGTYVKNPQQLTIWSLLAVLVLVIPALFYTEPNLKPGLRLVFTWMPTSVVASLWRYACSTGVSLGVLGLNLVVALAFIFGIFSLVVWQVRQADR